MLALNAKLYLLGSVYLEQAGKRVGFDTRKAMAMLVYLVITGSPVQRDTFAAMLWPENDQTGARAALRRTLSVLKSGLSAANLSITRELISFVPSDVFWCDALEFRKLVEESKKTVEGESNQGNIETLEKAVSLYKGDFLAGFTLRDSPAFDDWQYMINEEYKQMLSGAYEQLALVYCRDGSFSEAIRCARSWLTLDPLREETHRLLMRYYNWAGQRNAALQQYRECVQILDRELGVPPVEETTLLYSQILEGRAQPNAGQKSAITEIPGQTAQERSHGMPTRAFQLPLVGRSLETGTMLRIYQNKASKGYLLILQGEPGVGKTRLAEDFITFAERQGASILTSRAYPGEKNLAYSLFIDAFQSIVLDDEVQSRLEKLHPEFLHEASRLIPQMANLLELPLPDPWSETPLAQARFFEAIRQVIFSLLAGSPPGILFLDDLTWADPASLELLAFLVRRLSDHAVFILVTVNNEPLPESLDQIIYESQRAGISSTINLNRLIESELTELVRVFTKLSQDQSAQIAQRIYQETEGLPYFIIEYLEWLYQEINNTKDMQDLIDREWQVPGNVLNLLKTRLSGLNETTWQVLTTASVIGRSFDFETLQAASGRSDQETLTSIETLLSKRLIEEIQSTSGNNKTVYDFSHDRLRQFVYQQTNTIRRRLLHRRIAEVMIQQSHSGTFTMSQASVIAYHSLQAGLENQATKYYEIAGDHASSIYAHRIAIEYYQAALAAGTANPGKLHERIGDLYTHLGEYKLAITSYLAASASTDEDRQASIEHKLGNVYGRSGDYDLAACYYHSALEIAAQDSFEAASIYADLSQVARYQENIEKALSYAKRSLDLAQKIPSDELVAKAQNHLGILERARGNYTPSEKHLETSLAIARSIHELTGEAAALNNLALLYADQMNYSKGIEYTRLALEICQKIGDRHQEAALLNHLAELYHANQNEALSIEYLKKAVTIFAEISVDGESISPTIWMLSEW
jgi:DNA-binding SARP family transcriptional activator